MVASAITAPASLEQLHARFLSILGRIRTHLRIYFRHIACHFKRADLVSEGIALAWKWFVRLVEKGKRPEGFVSMIATYAAKAVKSGRRVCGQLKPKDVLSERAQQRKGFTVGKLPDYSTLSDNPLQAALTDNTVSPVIDQVQFRCDFPAWTKSRCRRDRRLIHDMATGERTQDLARRFHLSQARVSQLRREFKDDYDRFCDSAVAAPA